LVLHKALPPCVLRMQ